MKLCLRSAATIVLTGLTAWTSPLMAELSIGDKAPEFQLAGSDGKTYKLKDLQGQHVVIAWFPKAFTGG